MISKAKTTPIKAKSEFAATFPASNSKLNKQLKLADSSRIKQKWTLRFNSSLEKILKKPPLSRICNQVSGSFNSR